MPENFKKQLSIDEHSVELGLETPKMAPTERAKFWLAKWVLLSGAILMVLAWGIQFAVAMWGLPDIGDCRDAASEPEHCRLVLEIVESRTNAASSIFEFAKTWIPPVITLVLGYYFARENNAPDDSE